MYDQKKSEELVNLSIEMMRAAIKTKNKRLVVKALELLEPDDFVWDNVREDLYQKWDDITERAFERVLYI